MEPFGKMGIGTVVFFLLCLAGCDTLDASDGVVHRSREADRNPSGLVLDPTVVVIDSTAAFSVSTDRYEYRLGEDVQLRIRNQSDVELLMFHDCGLGLQRLADRRWWGAYGCTQEHIPPFPIPAGQEVVGRIQPEEPGNYRFAVALGWSIGSQNLIPREETISNVFHVVGQRGGRYRQWDGY